MRRYIPIFLSCALISVCAGCKKEEATQRSEFDVCALLTKQEIETIQGSRINETKSSARSDGGFRVSQCFYTAEDFSKSVSLAVTQPDPTSSGKRSVNDFWSETLGRFNDTQKNTNSDDEERKRLGEQAHRQSEDRVFIPPKRIGGIGDDAFWSPSRVGGAIYVLKKDVFIRISIGGRDDEQRKLDKSKTLAQKAINRL